MKALITGAGGLVGRAVAQHYLLEGEPVVGFDHAGLDITDGHRVNAVFDRERPDVVVNCAAWTDVDACEFDPQRAKKTNSAGPEILALACRKFGALFITLSTDYVFDGEKDGFYTQRDQPNPQSVYAISKLAGEQRAQVAWARTILVRSGYIFGPGGTNFLSTVVARAQQGEPVRAINDMLGTPTYTHDLAGRIYQLARLDLPGIYHVVNNGEGATFADFARQALEMAGLDQSRVENINLEELKRAASRPRNSRLRCFLSEAIGLEPLPFWQDAVRDFVGRDSAELSGSLVRGSV